MKTQYSMNPYICDVANLVLSRHVYTHVVQPDREQMGYPKRAFGAFTIILDGLLKEYQFNHVTEQKLCFAPYDRHENIKTWSWYDLNTYFKNDIH